MKKPELVSLLIATTVFVALIGAVFFFRTSFRPKIPTDDGQTASKSYSEEPFVDGTLNINGAGVYAASRYRQDSCRTDRSIPGA